MYSGLHDGAMWLHSALFSDGIQLDSVADGFCFASWIQLHMGWISLDYSWILACRSCIFAIIYAWALPGSYISDMQLDSAAQGLCFATIYFAHAVAKLIPTAVRIN